MSSRSNASSAGLFGSTGQTTASGSTATVGQQTAIGSSVQASLSSLANRPQSTGAQTAPTSDGIASPIVTTQQPIFACTPASYTISGGAPPYTAFIIRSGDANATILHTLPYQAAAGTGSWGVDLPPGTSITFVGKDSRNATGYSVPIVIQTGSTTSCIAGDTSSTSTHVNAGAIAGGVVGGVIGLALLALLAWAFVIKPARAAKSKQGGFYEQDGEESDRTTSKLPAGSYNLSAMDYRAPSIPPDVQERLPLPAYRPEASRDNVVLSGH